jgi:hypothetical protein
MQTLEVLVIIILLLLFLGIAAPLMAKQFSRTGGVVEGTTTCKGLLGTISMSGTCLPEGECTSTSGEQRQSLSQLTCKTGEVCCVSVKSLIPDEDASESSVLSCKPLSEGTIYWRHVVPSGEVGYFVTNTKTEAAKLTGDFLDGDYYSSKLDKPSTNWVSKVPSGATTLKIQDKECFGVSDEAKITRSTSEKGKCVFTGSANYCYRS